MRKPWRTSSGLLTKSLGTRNKVALARGFKSKANRIAVGLRHQLGLPPQSPIDVHALAHHLGISVVPLSAFSQWCEAQVAQLIQHDAGGFSASLISFGDGRRMIIVNDDHSPARQNSDIAHEIGHTLLAHPLEVLSSMIGCRDFDPDLEDEANHLAGYLLVPNQAAWRIVSSGMETEAAEAMYGVSRQMLDWRLNMSGARQRLQRGRA